MRPVFAILLSLVASAATSLAQQFRIVTWQLDSLPPVKAGVTNSSPAEQRFNDIATTLNSTDADVIVLYGIQDSETAKKISVLIKSKKYSVAHHAAFRHGGSKGTIAGGPVAILSRRERMAGKSIEWSQTGRIEMPGGFSFVVFRHGQAAVSLYVASLPASLTNGVSSADGKYFARKRNYAAQYLAHHASWMATTFTNALVATYLTGDFQLTPKGPVTDDCSKILEASGFRALAPGTTTDKSTASITNSLELDRVQDPIFTKGVEFIASRQINRPPPEHPLVVCDLTFKPPGTTAKTTGKPPVERPPVRKPLPEPEPLPPPVPVIAADTSPTPAAVTAPARALENPAAPTALAPTPAARGSLAAISPTPSISNRRWIWWTAAGLLVLVVAIPLVRTWAVRRQIAASADAKRIEAPLFLELQAASTGIPPAVGQTSILREASTTTGQTDRHPWQSQDAGAGDGARRRMTPHLKQLMRDVVIAWLTRQRTQLLESHERGTQQVLELHARVEKIRQHFQERMRAQQQRIVELDSALRSKEKVIVELIRARRPEAGG
jgi:hypothetical protein